MNIDGMTSLAVFVGIGLFSIIILGIVFSRLYRKNDKGAYVRANGLWR